MNWRLWLKKALIYSTIFGLSVGNAISQPLVANPNTSLPSPKGVDRLQHAIKSINNVPIDTHFTSQSISSQQLGLSGPLAISGNYSDLTGYYWTAKYTQVLSEQLAVSALAEQGAKMLRLGTTVGYRFDHKNLFKISIEQLRQDLPFSYDTGNVNERVQQNAIGAKYRWSTNHDLFRNIELGGYYAKAQSRALATISFVKDNLHYLNYRRIAGGTIKGLDIKTDLRMAATTLVSPRLFYDNLVYDYTAGYTPASNISDDRFGLGAGLNLTQLITPKFKVSANADIRQIANNYQMELAWLPTRFSQQGLELSLTSQNWIARNTAANHSIGVQLRFSLDGVNQRLTGYQLDQSDLADIKIWTESPAVHMDQVFAVAEQKTVLMAPAITEAKPNTGPVFGGTIVTLSGSNFVPGATVFVGAAVATRITISSPAQLTFTTPAGQPGVVDIKVINPDGQTAVLKGGFQYNSYNQPFISALSPASGPAAGADIVTIEGSHLDINPHVTFAGQPADIIERSATSLKVKTPPKPASSPRTVDVAVITDAGNFTLGASYSYIDQPGPISLDKHQGSTAGGDVVTLTSQNLLETNPTISFGGLPGTNIKVLNDTQVEVTTPAHSAGPVDVTLKTLGGEAILANAYTYQSALPIFDSLSRNSGRTTGGDLIIIHGANLENVVNVKFGGIDATINSETQSDSNIQVITPEHVAGRVAIEMITREGEVVTAEGVFTYVASPTITIISPNTGPTVGGEVVNIIGKDLASTTSVTFGSNLAHILSISDEEIQVISPGNTTTGSVSLRITTAYGTNASTYTYEQWPISGALNPVSGPAAGGTEVTMNIPSILFSAPQSVTFGGVPATTISFSPPNIIRAKTPAHYSGPVIVVVRLLAGFTYYYMYTYT